MADDPLTLLARSLDQAATVIARVDRDQAGAPTPCRSWTVGQLVEHMVHDLDNFTVTARGGAPDWSRPAPEVADWAGEFRRGADELLDAWRAAGDLSGTTQLPGMGEVPARVPVDVQTGEFAVHAWDLAKATGQPTDALDADVAEAALAQLRSMLAPSFRGSEEEGKAFGPQVRVPHDAPPYDRLAAFAGRDPR